MAQLIKEWRKGHKMWSVRLGIAAAIIAGLQPVLPKWEGILPEWAYAALASLVAISGVATRFLYQPEVRDDA